MYDMIYFKKITVKFARKNCFINENFSFLRVKGKTSLSI